MPRQKLKGFTSFESVESALRKFLKAVTIEPGVEALDIVEAVGRVASHQVKAPRDYPPFDRAAMDGFAVRSEDVISASEREPVELRVVGRVEAGSRERVRVGEGEAAMIFTGGRIPEGADAVVPFEYSTLLGDHVLVFKPVPKYGNVSRAGEDFRAGDTILERGTVIRPWHVTALAESGVTKVRVFKPLRIAIVNTGDELKDYREAWSEDEVVNSSGPLIESYVKEIGCVVAWSRIVRDDVNEVRTAIREGLRDADIVITTGGSSIGGKDLVPEAVEGIPGSEPVFHGVNLRPGRTAGAYVVNGKPILMLSGLPVACFIGLEVFLKPLVRKLYGVKEVPEPTVRARLTRRVANVAGFRSYYRVVLYREGGVIYAEPLRLTGSGIISTLIRGNGILEIKENVEGYEEGSEVVVKVIAPIYEGKPDFINW